MNEKGGNVLIVLVGGLCSESSLPLFLPHSPLINFPCVTTFPELQPERKVGAGIVKVKEGIMASDSNSKFFLKDVQSSTPTISIPYH